MRVDYENKVVWCSDTNDLAFIDNKTTLVLVEQLIKFDGSYSLCELQDNYYESCNDKKIDLLYAILNGYSFKLEQPQKYYWRKKKEHLAWFEEEVYLTRFKFSDNENYCYVLGSKNGSLKNTEQQARKILKDDFDKFERVEVD